MKTMKLLLILSLATLAILLFRAQAYSNAENAAEMDVISNLPPDE